MKRKSSLSPACIASLLLLSAIHSWACSTNSTVITPLPTLGGSFLQVNALNSSGQITGFSFLPGDIAGHAFLVSGSAISDLGTLGGTFSQGFAINASGQVAGEASIPDDFESHAFLYGGGTMLDLGTLGGSFSSALAINDAGQVTGNSLTVDNLAVEGFLYSAGSMVSVGTLGGSSSFATAINEAGSVAGNSSTESDLETHAFLYIGGTMIDLGTLGGSYSAAQALNDSDVVVGVSTLASGEQHAFVHADNTMQDLGTLGGTFSSASAINNAGQIIGVSTTTSDAETHGFLYQGGTLTDLGTLGGTYSYAAALNNLGQVVGESTTTDGSVHAFLWQNGAMLDLNTLLPLASGWMLNSALFINDSGRIVGIGTFNGTSQWFALDPGSDSANNPPVAAAGQDQNVSCETQVILDGTGSSDPDGDTLSFQWSHAGNVFSTSATAVVLFDVGTYSITLTVTDPCGTSSQDELVVNVTDTLPPTVSGLAPVTIPADANCEGIVPNIVPNVVAFDNCTPAGALVITQTPPAGSLVSGGEHTVTVTVTDASGNVATANATLNIVDTIAPTIVSSPSTLTVSAGENCAGVMPNVGAQVVATDNCTPANGLVVTQSPAAGTPLGAGQHTVTVTVADAGGNAATTSVTLTVADTSAPIIASLTADPNVLSPPNNQLVPITVTVVASDNCDDAPVSQIISITANEPVPAGDILITGNLTAKLAASKASTGDERTYTITVRCNDATGNYSTATTTVVVPKNKSGSEITSTKLRQS